MHCSVLSADAACTDAGIDHNWIARHLDYGLIRQLRVSGCNSFALHYPSVLRIMLDERTVLVMISLIHTRLNNNQLLEN
jgi:hypothetical protein